MCQLFRREIVWWLELFLGFLRPRDFPFLVFYLMIREVKDSRRRSKHEGERFATQAMGEGQVTRGRRCPRWRLDEVEKLCSGIGHGG